MSKNKDDNNQDHNQSVLKLKEAQDKIKAGKSASAFDKLEGFFKNKAPQPKSEFDGTKGGKVIDKSAGLAAGYIYKEQSKENGEAQDTHIIKSAVRAVDLNNKNKKLNTNIKKNSQFYLKLFSI